jgi:tripartite-type tricarboxylate transporter receptor subunit TctC
MIAFHRRSLLLAAVGCLGACAIPPALAQAGYPTQPIRLIVPFPPGGGTDTVARLLVEKITTADGWNFVVENRPGAGGNIGLDALAKSKPDGYIIGLGQTSNLAINPTLYPRMPYNALSDFVPVALIAGQPMVLVVKAESPYKSLADLLAAAKAKPGSLSMASAGSGTVGHLAGELFAQRAGVKFLHVPYKGAAPAATDLMGGQVDLFFATPQAAIPLVKGGRLRALAVTSAKRVPVLPDVPTVDESGYKGFEATDWKALVAPAGTPREVVNRLNAAAEKALGQPETLARLLAEGSVPLGGTPEHFAQFLKAEHARWGDAVRKAGVKVE